MMTRLEVTTVVIRVMGRWWDWVIHSLESVVDIVPWMNTLVDVVPRGLRGVVALQCEVVPQIVD